MADQKMSPVAPRSGERVEVCQTCNKFAGRVDACGSYPTVLCGSKHSKWEAAKPSDLERDLAVAREALAAKDAEIAREKRRADNHWETLRSIRHIAQTSGDLSRIRTWVDDAGSGYTQAAEATLVEQQDRAESAEARLREVERALADSHTHAKDFQANALRAEAEKNVLLSSVHNGPVGARGTYLAVLCHEIAVATRPLKELVAALRATDAGHLSRIDGLKTRVEMLTESLREVEAERDALLNAHAITAEQMDHFRSVAVDANKENAVLLADLREMARLWFVVSKEFGDRVMIEELHEDDVERFDALARRHAPDHADEVQGNAPGCGKEDEG